ncbi:hypothetical protein EWB00_004174 [Schistosoma japonicum]|uniref:Uncharacterized protein n=1 Tax=Schistosoma japonicum TaxID=6182 RepID=A0A4Z2DVV9_SCHJA|nr:hypothetical protein EWB00_004174 [Schistosoma japonicum]
MQCQHQNRHQREGVVAVQVHVLNVLGAVDVDDVEMVVVLEAAVETVHKTINHQPSITQLTTVSSLQLTS